MKELVLTLFIIALICSCSSDNSMNQSFTNKEITSVSKEVINNSESPKLVQIFTVLKELVKSDLHHKRTKSIVISDADSIASFLYIKNIFSEGSIDSIEFYGAFGKYYNSPTHQPGNSLLVLYLNNEKLANQELDSLNVNWEKNFRATEGMFKAGKLPLF
jgi:hypothetical protein